VVPAHAMQEPDTRAVARKASENQVDRDGQHPIHGKMDVAHPSTIFWGIGRGE